MLVLGRKRSERIVIGHGPDAITVTIVRIGNQSVRVGVDAPAGVPIVRGELTSTPTESERAA